MLRVFFLIQLLSFLLLAPLDAQNNSSSDASALEDLAWMAGHWSSEERGTVTEEVWMAPDGGMMLGMNRGVSDSGQASFEALRIVEQRGEIIYYASPGGSQPTPFVLKEYGGNRVVFENARNDFPQRIVYQRENDQMTARIEGKVGGRDQAMEWNWKSVSQTKGKTGSEMGKTSIFVGLKSVVYRVDDLAKAKEWYAELLEAQPIVDEPYYVGFDLGDCELGLDPDVEKLVQGNNQPAYWSVKDCKKAVDTLLEKGATATFGPQDVGGGVIVATVVDPFGNTLGVIEEPGSD